MKNKKEVLSFDEAQARLQAIVSEGDYAITPIQFREIISVFITKTGKLKVLSGLLLLYKNQAAESFWNTALSLELARVFERVLADKNQAKDIANRILPIEYW
jgi:hypothetical protein